MRIIAVISKFLLLHLSVFLTIIKADVTENKEITSNNDRNESTDFLRGRHNHGEKINHHKFEGKRHYRYNHTKKFHNEHDKMMENQTEIMDSAFNKLKKGLLIIPGLGRGDRLDIVHCNIKLLVSSGILLHKTKKEEIENNELNGENDLKGNKEYENIWDCLIYIYSKKPNENLIPTHEFWNKTVELTYIENFCEIALNPGKLVSHNLHMVHPETVQTSY